MHMGLKTAANLVSNVFDSVGEDLLASFGWCCPSLDNGDMTSFLFGCGLLFAFDFTSCCKKRVYVRGRCVDDDDRAPACGQCGMQSQAALASKVGNQVTCVTQSWLCRIVLRISVFHVSSHLQEAAGGKLDDE